MTAAKAVVLQAVGPLFEHDCDDCVFLGTWQRRDLYFCRQSGYAGPTVIARSSSDGSDYMSGLSSADQVPALAEAKKRAQERGLLLR